MLCSYSHCSWMPSKITGDAQRNYWGLFRLSSVVMLCGYSHCSWMPSRITGDAQRFYWGCPEILLGAQRFYWGCPEKLLGMSHTVHTGFRMACNHDGLTSWVNTVNDSWCPVGLLGMPREITGDAQRFYWGPREITGDAQRYYWGLFIQFWNRSGWLVLSVDRLVGQIQRTTANAQ